MFVRERERKRGEKTVKENCGCYFWVCISDNDNTTNHRYGAVSGDNLQAVDDEDNVSQQSSVCSADCDLRRYSGSAGSSSSELCSSTSTDEGIYQEVDYDDDLKLTSSSASSCEFDSVTTSSKPSLSAPPLPPPPPPLPPANSVPSLLAVPPPPPPPLPPPDFFQTAPKLVLPKRSDNCDTKTDDTQTSSVRYVKNTLKKANSNGSPASPAFVPPQFASPPDDDCNIKPSEYLKRLTGKGSAMAKIAQNRKFVESIGTMQRSVSENHLYSGGQSIYETITETTTCEQTQTIQLTVDSSETTSVIPAKSETKSIQASSATSYCVTKDELQSITLKRTEYSSIKNNIQQSDQSELYETTKSSLIEELKVAKDLDGIKKVKESIRPSNEVRFKILEDSSRFEKNS